MGINVYLAGKVSKRCWRHEFVKGLRDMDPCPQRAWPVLEDAIAIGVHYCGPFFASCDHGCSHQPQSHGVIDGSCGTSYSRQLRDQHGGEGRHEAMDYVFRQCWDAVVKSDVLVAVLDHEAYGTMVEIGWAYALKKKVMVVSQNEVHEDLWFAQQCSSRRFDIEDAIDSIVKMERMNQLASLCESPIEILFFRECINRGFDKLTPAVKAGPYRLDLADVDNKIAVEIDGFDYHSSKEHIIKDRERQRNLEMMGWKIVRFAGSEVHRNVAKCVNDFGQIRRQHIQSIHS